MQRVTITLDDALMEALDGHMRAGGHLNRSEAIRDLVRIGIEKRGVGVSAGKPCVAALVYVYDHETRRLAERLTNEQHAHHDMSVATLHVHLDERKCLEIAVLRGAAGEVNSFAEHVIGERGVQYGQLVAIPVEGDAGAAAGHAHAHAHGHAHRNKRRPKAATTRRK